VSHHFILLDRLSLSPRTLTCLKGAGINKVDEVLEMSSPSCFESEILGKNHTTSFSDACGKWECCPQRLPKYKEHLR